MPAWSAFGKKSSSRSCSRPLPPGPAGPPLPPAPPQPRTRERDAGRRALRAPHRPSPGSSSFVNAPAALLRQPVRAHPGGEPAPLRGVLPAVRLAGRRQHERPHPRCLGALQAARSGPASPPPRLRVPRASAPMKLRISSSLSFTASSFATSTYSEKVGTRSRSTGHRRRPRAGSARRTARSPRPPSSPGAQPTRSSPTFHQNARLLEDRVRRTLAGSRGPGCRSAWSRARAPTPRSASGRSAR